MNTSRFALPLLAITLAAQEPSPAPATTETKPPREQLAAVLIVQCGATDLVLNKPLLDALVNEPECIDAVRKNGGTNASAWTELPAPHLAGTFQVHLSIRTELAQPSAEQQTRVVDAFVAHLRARLDQLLFTLPSEQGKARSAELTKRLEEQLVRRAAMQARNDTAAAVVADVTQRRTAYDQQLAAARLELVTQDRAREQVEKLRAEYAEAREQKRAEAAKLLADSDEQERRVAKLSQDLRGRGARSEDAEVRARLDEVNAAVRTLKARLDAVNAEAADAQRMLTVVLEQLPAGALDQQRARARLDALAEAQKQLEDLAAAAAKERTEAAQRDTETERLAIELTVTKSLLTEVEGKLARLQPVRYELLRSR